MDDEEKTLLNAPFSEKDDNIDERMYDTSSMRKTAKGNKDIKTAIIAVVVIASIIAVAIYGFTTLTSGFAQQPPVTINPGDPAEGVPSPVDVTSVYALQDPNNSSQPSALAIIVQPSGTRSMNFTCGFIAITLTTSTASYFNNNISDFVNASTFNSTYDANFTRYQSVAPSCSIIELNGNGDQDLDPGETFAFFLNLNASCSNCPLPADAQFTVKITAAFGCPLTFTSNMTTDITPMMNLSFFIAPNLELP